MNQKFRVSVNGGGHENEPKLDFEGAVQQRYGQAAHQGEAGLCVPTRYNPALLEAIPEEILEKDYGCGDPSRYVREGEFVLDLGSGSGKACYILSQVVGPKGWVVGVDFNEEMLLLAEKYREGIGQKLGYQNVEFRRGRIQNLSLDLGLVGTYLASSPVQSIVDLFRLREFEERISREKPLIPDNSIDVIVSNCVLNLVRPEDKRELFSEMHRVLKRGGRIAISDVVSDEPVTDSMRNDPELWSCCVSGAFQEEEFLGAFEQAGFYGIRIEEIVAEPYQTVEGIEFRSMTLTAYKGKEGSCMERNQAVIYRGPWKQVMDDDNHALPRGVRVAVCDKTYQIFSRPPYQDHLTLIPPREEIPMDRAGVFDCSRDSRRHPRETKGMDYTATHTPPNVCGPGSDCCP